jgi:hypothetical protein
MLHNDVIYASVTQHSGRASTAAPTSTAPPLTALTENCRQNEALFAQAEIIEQAASVSLRRAEQVDQSILARAFRGELR